MKNKIILFTAMYAFNAVIYIIMTRLFGIDIAIMTALLVIITSLQIKGKLI